MCLDKLDPKPQAKGNYGYKLFTTERGELTSIFTEYKYPVGRWMEDEKPAEPLPYQGQNQYPTGFHVFASLQGLGRWINNKPAPKDRIRRVLIDDVVATGRQDGVKVIVARKIKIGRKEYNPVAI